MNISTESTVPTLLGGIRVLDICDEKGVYCSRLLADMGADVVRIESPRGERVRNIGPFYKDEPLPENSLFHWHYNAGKTGITLNILSDKGRDIFKRLVETADILIEGYPPGYLEGLKLGFKDLNKVNPRLIMVSITGFGQDGPYHVCKSSDIVVEALGGLLYVNGEPSSPPLMPYGNQSYHTASIFGAMGAMLALLQRRFSGEGQHVDVSMQECMAAIIEHVNVYYFYLSTVAKRQGSLHWSTRFAFRNFPCKDGYVLLPMFQEWDTVIEWMDSEGMAVDLKGEKWIPLDYKLQHINHIIEVYERWTKTHTVAELVEQAQLMRLAWAPIYSTKEVMENEQLIARGFYTEVEHPELQQKFLYPGAPAKFSESPMKISRRAPLLGEHNKAIYRDELGLSNEEISRLASEGVI